MWLILRSNDRNSSPRKSDTFQFIPLPLFVPLGHSTPQDAPEYHSNRCKQIEPNTTAGIVGSTVFIAEVYYYPEEKTRQHCWVHQPNKQSSQVVRRLCTNKLQDGSEKEKERTAMYQEYWHFNPFMVERKCGEVTGCKYTSSWSCLLCTKQWKLPEGWQSDRPSRYELGQLSSKC